MSSPGEDLHCGSYSSLRAQCYLASGISQASIVCVPSNVLIRSVELSKMCKPLAEGVARRCEVCHSDATLLRGKPRHMPAERLGIMPDSLEAVLYITRNCVTLTLI